MTGVELLGLGMPTTWYADYTAQAVDPSRDRTRTAPLLTASGAGHSVRRGHRSTFQGEPLCIEMERTFMQLVHICNWYARITICRCRVAGAL